MSLYIYISVADQTADRDFEVTVPAGAHDPGGRNLLRWHRAPPSPESSGGGAPGRHLSSSAREREREKERSERERERAYSEGMPTAVVLGGRWVKEGLKSRVLSPHFVASVTLLPL